MAFYFIGGEDHDLSKIGVAVTSTTAGARRAGARCSLSLNTFFGSDGWQGKFTNAGALTSLTSFWLTARLCVPSSFSQSTTSAEVLSLLDGANRKLVIKTNLDNSLIPRLYTKNNAGTITSLVVTPNGSLSVGAIYKFDIQVINYGASGTFNLYIDNALWLTYTGNLTTDGSTSLSGFILGCAGGNNAHHWSEVICSSDDTRSMSLITLPPAANGNVWNWSGSYASVDEVTLDDADMATSSTSGQIAQSTLTTSALTGNPGIRAVAVTARVSKGATGPTKANIGIRTGGTDYWTGDMALTDIFENYQGVWETNPAGGNWLATDITTAGFNMGIKSVT